MGCVRMLGAVAFGVAVAVAAVVALAAPLRAQAQGLPPPVDASGQLDPAWRVAGLPDQKPPLTQFNADRVDGRLALRIEAAGSYGNFVLDRAIADSAAHGWVKVLTEPGKDRILGVTLVGLHAGDLIAEYVLAMKHGLGLNKILGTIHTYPTLAEANKYAAGEWKRAHAPARLLAWARRYHDWKRR